MILGACAIGECGSSSLSTGIIVIIVIGSLIVLGLLAFLISKIVSKLKK